MIRSFYGCRVSSYLVYLIKPDSAKHSMVVLSGVSFNPGTTANEKIPTTDRKLSLKGIKN